MSTAAVAVPRSRGAGRGRRSVKRRGAGLGLLGQRVAKAPRACQRSLSPARLFIVTCAVEAAIRAAAYERLPFFGTQEFEDELVQLV